MRFCCSGKLHGVVLFGCRALRWIEQSVRPGLLVQNERRHPGESSRPFNDFLFPALLFWTARFWSPYDKQAHALTVRWLNETREIPRDHQGGRDQCLRWQFEWELPLCFQYNSPYSIPLQQLFEIKEVWATGLPQIEIAKSLRDFSAGSMNWRLISRVYDIPRSFCLSCDRLSATAKISSFYFQ